MQRRLWTYLLMLFGLGASAETNVYFGTYTYRASKGIYHATLNLKTGELSEPTLVAELRNPAFLAVHNWDGRIAMLHAVSGVKAFKGEASGAVHTFQVAEDGSLAPVSSVASRGIGPCHLSVSASRLLVANYGGGSVSSYTISPDSSIRLTGFAQHSGASGVDERRQAAPHPHSIYADPRGERAYVPDLGLDHVRIYKLGFEGELSPNDPPFVKTPPGGGPRHFAFHPSGRFAWTNLELTSQVTGFSCDPKTGALTIIETLSTLPADREGDKNSSAECLVHPNGRFLYVSNRGHDSIAIFRIAPATGTLTLLEIEPSRGKIPRNFGIDPSGTYLIAVHEPSNSAVVFRIDPKTGALDFTGHSATVPTPVCVRFQARTADVEEGASRRIGTP